LKAKTIAGGIEVSKMFLNKMPLKKIVEICAIAALFGREAARADAGGLKISPRLAALPVMAGLVQGIEISLPKDAPSGTFDADIEALSGWGVLLFPSGPSASGRALISRERPIRLDYRWSGATPVSASVAEKIAVEIPDLGLSGEMGFQVGVDVRIREISLPANVRAGAFNPVEILVQDEFNPSLDIAELLDEIGASVEVSMSLVGESTAAPSTGDDPVVRAFFGEEDGKNEASYPGSDFKTGSVVGENGKFVWRGEGGRAVGITPHIGGKYNVEATLKASLGGAPLKHWSSPEFEVSGHAPGLGMPEFFAPTLEIMSRMDAGASMDAEKKSREFLDRGDMAGAIASLGASLRKAFAASPLPSLGKYAAALASSGKGDEEILGFLGLLMRGFEDCGVLVFTRSGAAEWSVKDGAAYENERYVSVPFSAQKNIVVRIAGSGADDVSLWKIIAQGTNAKKYPKGNWIKELTVYTAEVKPPQTQAAN
jgi:hypothetical protein